VLNSKLHESSAAVRHDGPSALQKHTPQQPIPFLFVAGKHLITSVRNSRARTIFFFFSRDRLAPRNRSRTKFSVDELAGYFQSFLPPVGTNQRLWMHLTANLESQCSLAKGIVATLLVIK
jgi:hypothetical protein